MKLYKLTDEHGCTHNNTQWGPGVTHETSGEGGLCGPGWLHAYTCPLLAVLLNPIHANFHKPRLWEAEGELGADDRGLKCGTTRLTTVCEIPLPQITTEHRVRFAILCAMVVGGEDIPAWAEWARAWLNSSDRTAATARAAAYAAYEAARAAAYAAWAAAWAAAYAAWAAAWAAAYAADANRTLDLATIAHEAIYGVPTPAES